MNESFMGAFCIQKQALEFLRELAIYVHLII